ncbi:hypothetical protein JOE61_001661 [Nocardioides salarius]|uniref:Uncharacterized protein n=1 Tax=Nocardioides salarius TaxID=374513 RepID=A0ABS2M9J8_9ACTN|nr:hypothetical protein [Nocardioides salarius]MBM7507847.1 hypothetical protein [Nocardioides salarius]
MATTAAHPINGTLARMHSLLDELAELAESPLWSMSHTATAEALVDFSQLEARVVELRSRTLAHAETVAVAETNASPSVAVWHSNATRSTKRESFPPGPPRRGSGSPRAGAGSAGSWRDGRGAGVGDLHGAR